MVAVNAVVDGLQVRLATISGMRTYSEWPDQPNPPCSIVMPAEEFVTQITIDGGYQMVYDVVTLVPIQSGVERGQRLLNTYCDTDGSTSIRAAVEGDSTLGGVVADLYFSGIDGYGRTYEFGTVRYLGVTHRFTILI